MAPQPHIVVSTIYDSTRIFSVRAAERSGEVGESRSTSHRATSSAARSHRRPGTGDGEGGETVALGTRPLPADDTLHERREVVDVGRPGVHVDVAQERRVRLGVGDGVGHVVGVDDLRPQRDDERRTDVRVAADAPEDASVAIRSTRLLAVTDTGRTAT